MNPVTVPEITPRELFEALGKGEKLLVLDVRAPVRVEPGKNECALAGGIA